MNMLFIFDMGNVVTQNVDVIPEISDKLKIPENEIRKYCGDDFRDLSIGFVSTEQFWIDFSAYFNIPIHEDYLYTCFHPVIDPEMAGLLLKIRDRQHRVVCGTNTLDSHYRHHLENDFYQVFDKVYASHMMGVAKPDPDFYSYILREEACMPSEAVFVDDLIENVVAARNEGIRAFQFFSIKRLLQDFNDSGIYRNNHSRINGNI